MFSHKLSLVGSRPQHKRHSRVFDFFHIGTLDTASILVNLVHASNRIRNVSCGPAVLVVSIPFQLDLPFLSHLMHASIFSLCARIAWKVVVKMGDLLQVAILNISLVHPCEPEPLAIPQLMSSVDYSCELGNFNIFQA